MKGKIVSRTLAEAGLIPQEGMQVYVFGVVATIRQIAGDVIYLNYDSKELQSRYFADSLRTLIVEYEKNLSLKHSDWQQAIVDGLVDSEKEAEFDIRTVYQYKGENVDLPDDKYPVSEFSKEGAISVAALIPEQSDVEEVARPLRNRTIYVIINTEGGKEGNLRWIVEAFTTQLEAETYVKEHGRHLKWTSCPLSELSQQDIDKAADSYYIEYCKTHPLEHVVHKDFVIGYKAAIPQQQCEYTGNPELKESYTIEEWIQKEKITCQEFGECLQLRDVYDLLAKQQQQQQPMYSEYEIKLLTAMAMGNARSDNGLPWTKWWEEHKKP